MVLDPLDIQNFNDLLFKKREKTITAAEKKALTFYLSKAEKAVRQYSPEQQKEIRFRMRSQYHSLKDIETEATPTLALSNTNPE